jgi:predicted ATPase
MLSRLYDLKNNPRSNLFKRYLEGWLYYDINPQQLRHPGARTMDPILAPDGSNLASVLFLLKNADERLYRRLIDIAKKAIEPRLELLSFYSPALNQVFMYGEDSAGNRFDHRTMSNGTLRFLALAYLLMGKQSRDKTGVSRLVIIEEPETGLYAGHLKELFSLIDTSGENGQFVFTSHSPYFIDLFDGMLEGVTLARRGQTHSQLVKPDVEKLSKLLEQMPLGEIYFREMLAP